MAERRMFAKSIVMSDAFLDMPLSARCLYFTLGMLADDDGFVGNPKSIMRQCGASKDDMNILLQKRYVLGFESGVIVIKHWRMNNYLQNDRHKSTTYLEELATLKIDDRGAYTEKEGMYIECIQNVYTGKDSIDKYSKEDILSGNPTEEIINYLNSATGKNFKATTDKTKKCIHARLNEGFTVDDFKTVIDIKSKKWLKDDKMRGYLRPETLFGTKFESYLNESTDDTEEELDFLNTDWHEWTQYQWSDAIKAGKATQDDYRRIRKEVLNGTV